jgi:hypothetical protein
MSMGGPLIKHFQQCSRMNLSVNQKKAMEEIDRQLKTWENVQENPIHKSDQEILDQKEIGFPRMPVMMELKKNSRIRPQDVQILGSCHQKR